MEVRLTKVDGTEITRLNLPAGADVIVWGKEKPRFFVHLGSGVYREAIVAFVNPNKGDLPNAG